MAMDRIKMEASMVSKERRLEEQQRMVQHILDGKIYVKKEKEKMRHSPYMERDIYFFPPSALNDVKKMFHNAMLDVLDEDFIKVDTAVQCKMGSMNPVLRNGDVIQRGELCGFCKHMVKGIVGECTYGDEFEPVDQRAKEETVFKENIPSDYWRVKSGYAQSTSFSDHMIMTPEHILERMEDLKSKGVYQACKKQFEDRYCDQCVMRGTMNCHGWQSSRTPFCKNSRELVLMKADLGINKSFGSKQSLFSLLLFCGHKIQYYDEKTKHWSKRIVGLPSLPGAGKKAEWILEMGKSYWPYILNDNKGRSNETKKETVTDRISTDELIKKYKDELEGIDDIQYDPKYDHLIQCAYLFLNSLNGNYRYRFYNEANLGRSICISYRERFRRSERLVSIELNIPTKNKPWIKPGCTVTTCFSKRETETTFDTLETLLKSVMLD